VIFRYSDEVIIPGGQRAWVCRPPHGVSSPPFYEGGAYVLTSALNIPMWFNGDELQIVTVLDRLVDGTR
jgi:hypothetical protein